MGLFTQAFSLLADPPGNLIYHLVLVFSISGALQAAFIHWRISAFPQARRTVIGLTISDGAASAVVRHQWIGLAGHH